jgi:hypothetical protein
MERIQSYSLLKLLFLINLQVSLCSSKNSTYSKLLLIVVKGNYFCR